MGVNFDFKKKITVNGQEYESLDEIPDEFRTTVQNALASGAVHKTTININGKTYSSVEELPAPLRAIVGGLTSLAVKRVAGATSEGSDAESPSEPSAEAVRPEPVLSMKLTVVAICLAALLFWLARLVL